MRARRSRISRRAWLAVAAAGVVAACGRKGNLYLPDGQTGPVDPDSTELPPQQPDGSEDPAQP